MKLIFLNLELVTWDITFYFSTSSKKLESTKIKVLEVQFNMLQSRVSNSKEEFLKKNHFA